MSQNDETPRALTKVEQLIKSMSCGPGPDPVGNAMLSHVHQNKSALAA